MLGEGLVQGHRLKEGQKSPPKFRVQGGVGEVSPRALFSLCTSFPVSLTSPLASSEFVSTSLLLDRKYLVNILFKIRDLIYYLSCDICNLKISLQKEGKI